MNLHASGNIQCGPGEKVHIVPMDYKENKHVHKMCVPVGMDMDKVPMTTINYDAIPNLDQFLHNLLKPNGMALSSAE